MSNGIHNQNIGEVAENEVINIFLRFGWKAQLLLPDVGEDRLVRIYKENVKLPFHFFVQIKGTEHIKITNGTLTVPLQRRLINNWLYMPTPVIVIAYDVLSPSHTAYWEILQNGLENYDEHKKGNFKFPIPAQNVLSQDSLESIAIYIKKQFMWYSKIHKQMLKEYEDIGATHRGRNIDSSIEGDVLTWLQNGSNMGVRFQGRLAQQIQEIMKTENLTLKNLILKAIEADINFRKKVGRDSFTILDQNGKAKLHFDSIEDFDKWRSRKEYENLGDLG